MPPFTMNRTALGRLLRCGPDRIVECDEGFQVHRNGASEILNVASIVRPVQIHRGLFWARAEITTDTGTTTLRGFRKTALEELVARSNERLHDQGRERLRPNLEKLLASASEIDDLLSGRRYIRHSRLLRGVEAAGKSRAICAHPFWEPCATAEERALATTVEGFVERHEQLSEETNAHFVQDQLQTYQELFDRIESKPLTAAQRRACVLGEDNNLVLAGAGTGKTSTMMGRAAYLLASGQAQPQALLMLAFARKAADEMQKRQDSRLGSLLNGGLPAIKTFHGLGLEIIGRAEGKRPDVSPLAEDDHRLGQFIDGQLEVLGRDSNYRRKILRFFGSERYPYRNPFDFHSMLDYLEYVRCNELRTLKGEVVKSFEECEIANFLGANGVRYEYERPYEIDTSGPDFRRYKPDFYLPDYGVYIEHFALDKNGQPPGHFDVRKYLDGVSWKRQLHTRHGTKLVETYSYLKREGQLESQLAERLREAGVQLDPRSEEALLDELKQSSVIAELAVLLTKFLTLYKQSAVTLTQLQAEATRDLDGGRLLTFYDLFVPVHEAYEQHLRDQNEIDFADMILRATSHVESGRFVSPYAHIMVDEFQDISALRADLIKALLKQRPDAMLFAVGDDWQSIYRFTGSDIGYTSDFQNVFGATATVALDTTFRFNDKIGSVASKFILKNPAQISKNIRSVSEVDVAAVSLLGVLDIEDGLRLALEAISARPQRADIGSLTVLVLARYNFVIKQWRDPRARLSFARDFPGLDVEFMTAHGAKGKEADFVVVLGLGKGKYGFPSEVPDDPILEPLLPAQEKFNHAEERRLFYVALTRARHRAYLVFNPLEASTFVTELLDPNQDYLVRKDEFFGEQVYAPLPHLECPWCGSGALVPRVGRYGRFVGCNHYPYCDYKEKPCPQCGSLMKRKGGSRVCLRDGCDAVVPICPSCGGSMVERNGPYGPFWGCTNYRRNAEFVCTQTKNR